MHKNATSLEECVQTQFEFTNAHVGHQKRVYVRYFWLIYSVLNTTHKERDGFVYNVIHFSFSTYTIGSFPNREKPTLKVRTPDEK